jgi:hypothetical protein
MLAVGACTGTGATTTASPRPSGAASVPASTPAASVDLAAEINATVAGLATALTAYTAGDKQGALDAIAETYEEHFEDIEDPLGEIDHDFMESLEELIAVKIRAAINEGKPVTEVAALVAEANTALEKARDLLS